MPREAEDLQVDDPRGVPSSIDKFRFVRPCPRSRRETAKKSRAELGRRRLLTFDSTPGRDVSEETDALTGLETPYPFHQSKNIALATPSHGITRTQS